MKIIEKKSLLSALEFFLQGVMNGIEQLVKDNSNVDNNSNANQYSFNFPIHNNIPSINYLKNNPKLLFYIENILHLLLACDSQVIFSFFDLISIFSLFLKIPEIVEQLVSTLERFDIYFTTKSDAIPFVLQKVCIFLFFYF